LIVTTRHDIKFKYVFSSFKESMETGSSVTHLSKNELVDAQNNA